MSRKVYKSLGIFALPHPTEGLLGGGWGDYQRMAYPRYFGKDKKLKAKYLPTLKRNQAEYAKRNREHWLQFEKDLDGKYPHSGNRIWSEGHRMHSERDCRVCVDSKCECACEFCDKARKARHTEPAIRVVKRK